MAAFSAGPGLAFPVGPCSGSSSQTELLRGATHRPGKPPVVGRAISVPASHTRMRRSCGGSMEYRTTRPSTSERPDRTRPASASRCNCRAMAGRLKPSSAASSDGRRGRCARATTIRRRVRSASRAIPSPLRLGMSLTRPMLVLAALPAVNRRAIGDHRRPVRLPRDRSAWTEPPGNRLGATLPAPRVDGVVPIASSRRPDPSWPPTRASLRRRGAPGSAAR